MSFRFKPQERPVGKDFRTIALSQIDKGLKDVSDNAGNGDEIIHGLRKRCKKLRGLIRLVRPNFSDYRSVNAAIRDLAKALSQSRDAAVMAETFDKLVAENKGAVGNAEQLRALVAPEKASSDPRALLEQFQEAAGALRKRAEHWSLKHSGFEALEAGLWGTYVQMRKAMKTARKSGRPENFHEWRKRVKYHGFHLQLFTGVAPHALGAAIGMADTLGNLLGEHHDLWVMADTLAQKNKDASADVRRLAHNKQDELASRALMLGAELAAEDPDALVRRFATYWKNARRE